MPTFRYCSVETENFPDAELALSPDRTTYFHLVPSPTPNTNVATSGHSLSGFPASFTALRTGGGMWQIVAFYVPPSPTIHVPLSVVAGRMVRGKDAKGVVFSGPILNIPLSVAVVDVGGNVRQDQLTGYGELFRILLGHDEKLMDDLLQGPQENETDRLLAGLINEDDESVRRVISAHLSAEPDVAAGLIIGGTAMMFSRESAEAASQMQITHLSSLSENGSLPSV